MAEIGIIASIVGLVGAGAKLSITLFDLASTLGSAGSELQVIATEVTLFCSVLQQLQQTLERVGALYSAAALTTTQEIIDRCKRVFGCINDVLASCGVSSGLDSFPTVDFVKKVKWTFKKAKVQVLRSTLESCKITLNIMLITMEVARKVSIREFSSHETTMEDQQDKMVAQSLIISQRCSVNHLYQLEEETRSEENHAEKRLGPGLSTIEERHPKHRQRAPDLMGDLKITTDQSAIPLEGPQRTSTWLNRLISTDDHESEPHPGMRSKRFSSSATDDSPHLLMLKWTVSESQARSNARADAADIRKHVWSNDYAPKRSDSPASMPGSGKVGVMRMPTNLVSPTTVVTPDLQRAPDDHVPVTATIDSIAEEQQAPQVAFALDVAREVKQVGAMPATTYGVVAAGIDQYTVAVKQESLHLSCAYGGKVKTFTEIENPYVFFNQCEELGLDPQLLLSVSERP